MISEPSYQAARVVAESIEYHFSQLISVAREQGEKDLAPEPDKQMVEVILDTAFWTSLRHEEGHSAKISLAFLPPEKAVQPLMFGQRLLLTPDILTKLSPGIERAGVHLGVWHEKDEVYTWGTTLSIPNYCFVVDVSEPGLLVVKYRRRFGFGKFANVAVLKGDQVKVVNEESCNEADCPPLLSSLLGNTSPDLTNSMAYVLVQLAVSMRSHNRGGTLLVVPPDNQNWQESIIHPMKYTVAPAYSGLSGLMRRDGDMINQTTWQAAVRKEVESIAGLTAIDGATIINERYELLAFGAKIGRREGYSPVQQVYISEPVIGGDAVVNHPSEKGGMRHLSAAQFIHDQHEALALVASQDGQFTIFSWSSSEQMVRAYRIDSLLL